MTAAGFYVTIRIHGKPVLNRRIQWVRRGAKLSLHLLNELNNLYNVSNREYMTSNNKILIVEHKTVYGQDLIYPYCAQSKLFCKIANTETLPARVRVALKDAGYTFQIKPNYIDV